ncbi:hypothetical protein [Klebsiella aerogenes]|uniref:hypothetical protein n=1 Tax=Klebsiella aerogenes TaxID=548 RepID=UPI002A81696B|nr:hypothetical protein [Klebsiella aerogenes]WPS01968.1 hypothetical protein SM908_15560 [Klebsiella aerogenes]
MNIDTVNELIQSLESAGELSIKERKYLELAKAYADKEAESVAQALTFEKCRELSGCPAGVDLQDWVKQLAAENVQVRKRHRFIRALAVSILEHSGGRHDWRGAMEDASDLVKTVDEVYSNTPATDRIVAGIKADGVEEWVSSRGGRWNGTTEEALKFAKQLREGADK